MQNMPIKLKILFSIFIVESVLFFLSTGVHKVYTQTLTITFFTVIDNISTQLRQICRELSVVYRWLRKTLLLVFVCSHALFFLWLHQKRKTGNKIRISVVHSVFFCLKMKLRLNGFCVLFWPSQLQTYLGCIHFSIYESIIVSYVLCENFGSFRIGKNILKFFWFFFFFSKKKNNQAMNDLDFILRDKSSVSFQIIFFFSVNILCNLLFFLAFSLYAKGYCIGQWEIFINHHHHL